MKIEIKSKGDPKKREFIKNYQSRVKVHWIKLEDGLPEYGKEVLILTEKATLIRAKLEYFDEFNGDAWVEIPVGITLGLFPTHWTAPLELPEEGE